MKKQAGTIESIKREIFNLHVDNDWGRSESKIWGHLRHELIHSQLVKMSTTYLCAVVKAICLDAKHPIDRIDDILLTANIIDSRHNEADRRLAINYIIDFVSAHHPYGRDIKDRIDEVTAFTSLNI